MPISIKGGLQVDKLVLPPSGTIWSVSPLPVVVQEQVTIGGDAHTAVKSPSPSLVMIRLCCACLCVCRPQNHDRRHGRHSGQGEADLACCASALISGCGGAGRCRRSALAPSG